MDAKIPLTFEGATRQLRVLQRSGVEIGLNQVIEDAVVDYTQEICETALDHKAVTVHYVDEALTITDDADDHLMTTIYAPAPGRSFQLSFRNKAPQLMRYLKESTTEAFVDHH
ncbi:hypothetical protein ACFQ5M_07530 [Agrilactobacillus yilanensis]|uniref:Uncharacterized protein n=1 Tax=Agrilactobacillus yilanensis TaxID=2485997 RepID=A0ABW4J7P1_9LACO|nr:hypothetical protein [Agrilactobacillus yilanensis]